MIKPTPIATDKDSGRALQSALRTVGTEKAGLTALEAALKTDLAEPFEKAVAEIGNAKGRVIVTGMGKSGHVGQKLAATFASTGTPAFFVHPSEANHGDLGMITAEDIVIALSWSGETAELRGVIDYTRRFSIPLIGITANRESALGQAADGLLVLPRADEACPHGLAPTTSTMMQLALGDALAIALLESRGFTAHDFKTIHPGGQLGANLKYAGDVMHKGGRVPLAPSTVSVADALVIMTEKSLGCIGLTDTAGRLHGIITDGDLRRHMRPDLLTLKALDIMTENPRTISPDMLVSEAIARMNGKITALFVVEDSKPVGIVHIHDLLRIGVV